MPKVTIVDRPTVTTTEVTVSDGVANEASRYLAQLIKQNGPIGPKGNGGELRLAFGPDEDDEDWIKQAKAYYLREHKLVMRKLPSTAIGVKLADGEQRFQLTQFVAERRPRRP
jgi:hypothetical protein